MNEGGVKKPMRICSLLPSATEMLFALGCGDRVVGVTHECDFPEAAKAKPRLIRPRVDPGAEPGEIDRQVRALVEAGQSLYGIDAELLVRLEPDLIVTQDLCHVCAASPDDLAAALRRFDHAPEVVTLNPHSLREVWRDILLVGEETGTNDRAAGLLEKIGVRLGEGRLAVEDQPQRVGTFVSAAAGAPSSRTQPRSVPFFRCSVFDVRCSMFSIDE